MLILDYTGGNPHFTLDGVPAIRITEPTHGPLMIEHAGIRAGRPTSLLDIQWSILTWNTIDATIAPRRGLPDGRIVPVDRDFGRRLHGVSKWSLNEYERVSPAVLHREAIEGQRWRGRPSALLQFNVETLIRWRDLVASGGLTIRDLAIEAGVSEPAAARFARGEVVWWA